jgi:hypothetical protein
MTNSAEAYRDSPTKVLSASLGLKVAALIGVPVTAYATVWLFFVPNRYYYNWPDELGTFSALACSAFLFSVCWGAVCAYLIRRFSWFPKACNFVPSAPFLFGFIAVMVLHMNFAIMSFLTLPAALANKFCLRFAYPTVDQKNIYTPQSDGPTLGRL